MARKTGISGIESISTKEILLSGSETAVQIEAMICAALQSAAEENRRNDGNYRARSFSVFNVGSRVLVVLGSGKI